jgi:hypothetical protein
MHTVYHIFGLNIQSAVPLPSSPVHYEQKFECDVLIDYGTVPEELMDFQFKGAWYQASSRGFLLRIDGVARYYIQDGCRITVMPEEGADEDDVLLFLMGSAMGALLHQRNVLVLHAGAIVVNGKSLIFLGPSGIGKSTLTAGLYKRGYPFLADDVCAITSINGIPVVIPGFPRLKLWTDTLTKLKTERKGLKSIRGPQGFEKYFLPVDNAYDKPVPLRGGYGIQTAEVKGIEIRPLKGAEKINLLIANTYRLEFLKGQGGTASHFHHCAEIGSKIAVYQITRPYDAFLLEELMDLLEANF